jgi:nitrogen fixation NifU-like protein
MPGVYSEIVLDHFRAPRNVGELADANAVGRAGNPVSGAELALFLRVENGRICRVSFQSQGCTATIAAGSMLTELVQGRTLEAAAGLSRMDVEAALGGLPSTRRHAAALAVDAIRAAVADFQSRR